MFRAAMERIAKWLGYVKERTGRTRKSSENPLELSNIFIDIEKTIPPREEKPVNDANYGTEDTTDINGVYDEARITDVFRGGPDSVHRGLGAVYTKADDPSVLQGGILAALEGRRRHPSRRPARGVGQCRSPRAHRMQSLGGRRERA